jgi:dTDP-4-dehydrorhamnose 3,5-epimerase
MSDLLCHETGLPGALLIEPLRRADERGFFARTWCARAFAARGIHCAWVQCNVSFNKHTGTLRGLHYQVAPHEEDKLVRCTRGAIYDVIVDLRPGSATCGRWAAFELTADNGLALFIPHGFAHGFQTLADDSEVFYQMSEFYHPESARGLRWDDPALGIVWPACARRHLSTRDANFPSLLAR